MERTEKTILPEYGPGNPEFKVGQRVVDVFFNKKGTIDAVKSGPRIGAREIYDVLLDEPLTLKGSNRLQSFNYDQIQKLEE